MMVAAAAPCGRHARAEALLRRIGLVRMVDRYDPFLSFLSECFASYSWLSIYYLTDCCHFDNLKESSSFQMRRKKEKKKRIKPNSFEGYIGWTDM